MGANISGVRGAQPPGKKRKGGYEPRHPCPLYIVSDMGYIDCVYRAHIAYICLREAQKGGKGYIKEVQSIQIIPNHYSIMQVIETLQNLV